MPLTGLLRTTLTVVGTGLMVSGCTSPGFSGGAGASMAKVKMILGQSDWVGNDKQEYKDPSCHSHVNSQTSGECIYRCIGMWMHYLNPSTDATTDADTLASKYPCNSAVTDCTHSYIQGCDTSNVAGISRWISSSDAIPQAHVYLDWVGALAADIYSSLSTTQIDLRALRPQNGPDSFLLPAPTIGPGPTIPTILSVTPAGFSNLGPQPVIVMVNGDDPANPTTRLLTDANDPTKFAPWGHSVLVTGIQLDKSNNPIRIEIVDPDNNPLVATQSSPGYGGRADPTPGPGVPGVYYSIDLPGTTNAEFAAGHQQPATSVMAIWDAWTSVPGWSAKTFSQASQQYPAAGVGAFISVNVAAPDPVLSPIGAAGLIQFVGDVYEFFAK